MRDGDMRYIPSSSSEEAAVVVQHGGSERFRVQLLLGAPWLPCLVVSCRQVIEKASCSALGGQVGR